MPNFLDKYIILVNLRLVNAFFCKYTIFGARHKKRNEELLKMTKAAPEGGGKDKIMKLEIPECVDKPVENALSNVTDKPTREIGEILNDLLEIIFGRLHFSAEKKRIKYKYALEQYVKSCEEKIKSIPEERLTEPNLQIISGALEDSRFCIENETLREMFANLISSSLDSDKNSSVHPSFSNIIKQMSVLESRIFSTLKPDEVYPICEYQRKKDNEVGILSTNVLQSPDENIDIDTVCLRSIALSSLNRLGIVSLWYDKHTKIELYSKFLQGDAFEYLTKYCESLGGKLKTRYGILSLTPLGMELWKTCCENIEINFTDNFPTSFL